MSALLKNIWVIRTNSGVKKLKETEEIIKKGTSNDHIFFYRKFVRKYTIIVQKLHDKNHQHLLGKIITSIFQAKKHF
jgi:hypothetical protein